MMVGMNLNKVYVSIHGNVTMNPSIQLLYANKMLRKKDFLVRSRAKRIR
jgi:hypothetical protein